MMNFVLDTLMVSAQQEECSLRVATEVKVSKMMNFAFKIMNFVLLKMMNYAFKMMNVLF